MSDRPRVLVLEDDEEMRASLMMVLEDEGYEVIGAGRAEEAVAQAQEVPFDLIVSDVRLPGANGLDAVEQVRERQPAIRSMVVTGYSSEADSVRALQMGVDHYLRKPFTMTAFLEAVKRMMAERRREQQWAARERSLRRTSLALLEILVRQLPTEGLLGHARLGQRLALELGLADEAAEEVRMAALAAMVGSALPVEELPLSTRRLLESADDDEPPLGSRIVAVILALARARPSPKPGAALQESEPGVYDPKILALVDELVHSDARAGADPQSSALGKRRRSLLSLARMLEDGDQAAGALKAYQEVVSLAVTSREGIEALLGMARLDTGHSEEHARQAYQASRQLSPVLAASVALEAALLLGPQRGRPLAEESARAYQNLGLTGGQAQARLACQALTPQLEPLESEALNVLLQPGFSTELVESAGWLLPLLFTYPPEGIVQKALVRLIRDAPREAARALPGLTPQQKLALLRSVSSDELARILENDPDAAIREAAKKASGGVTGPPVVRLHALGPMEAFVGEERVPDKAWKSRKVRHLLARLASSAKPIPEEIVIDDLWPDDALRGAQSLRAAISSLRKALRPPRWEGEDPQIVVRASKCLSLHKSLPFWHDVDEFTRLCTDATGEESSNPTAAMALWRRAVQLYRGPYLEDCYSDWALLVRERVERQQFEALRRLCHQCLSQNQTAEVLDYGRRLLEVDPCCQEAYLLLMRANLALGRAEAAVRLFERCARALRQELAMEPSIELVEMHQRAILSLDSSPLVG